MYYISGDTIYDTIVLGSRAVYPK